MKVHVYENGQRRRRETYEVSAGDLDPLGDLARLYVEEWHEDTTEETDVVMEPADAEAEALPGWNESGSRLYVVEPIVTYKIRPVANFDNDARHVEIAGPGPHPERVAIVKKNREAAEVEAGHPINWGD